MKRYYIKCKRKKDEFSDRYSFYATTLNGDRIFGASCDLNRYWDVMKDKLGEWSINYGSVGSQSYKDKLPYVKVIKKAMSKLKQLLK